MNELPPFLTSVLPLIALVGVFVALIRRVLGGTDFAALYRAPAGDAWPRGVQEEDPRPWGLAAPAGATR